MASNGEDGPSNRAYDQRHGNNNPTSSSSTTTTTTSVTFGRRSRGNTAPAPAPASTSHRNESHLMVPTPAQSGHDLTHEPTQEPFPAFTPSASRVATRSSQISPSMSRIQSRPTQPDSTLGWTQLTPTVTNVARSSQRRPIGIKRMSSNDLSRQLTTYGPADVDAPSWSAGRRRSTSAPIKPGQQPPHGEYQLQRISTAGSTLAAVPEGVDARDHVEEQDPETNTRPQRSGSTRLRRASDAAKSAVSRLSGSHEEQKNSNHTEYETDVVDLLDVLDPEVAALTTLTNVQNSLFVPDLGRWLNRRPTFQLSREPSMISQRDTQTGTRKPLPPLPADHMSRVPTRLDIPSDIDEEPASRPRSTSLASVRSHMKEERYAVLPHGVDLNGWTPEEIEMLDDHVRHMLHSKRSKFKRSMRAFGKYIRNPLGFLVTLYAFLITVFGLVWVLFLIGWIYVAEDRKEYVIHVVDSVLVALFGVVGYGFAPFRAVDTYHMIFIAHYHRLSWRLRKERNLPKLQDHNDLPETLEKDADLEASQNVGNPDDSEFSVLTVKQQEALVHHQEKFSKSHSFYKAHETSTHHAFPLKLLIAIVCLLDAHSCLQISLGATTWGIDYKTRNNAITPTILSCSITVNILAGVLIKVGDKRTRKKDILETMYRQQLTEEAMKKVEKTAEKEKAADRKHDERLDEAWEVKRARSNEKGEGTEGHNRNRSESESESVSEGGSATGRESSASHGSDTAIRR